MYRFVIKGIMLIFIGLLAGCSQPVDSVTAHAKSYVFKAKDDFDPNWTTQVSGSIQLIKPLFNVFYQEGKKDRLAGLTREQALQKMENLRQDKSVENMETRHIFINQSYRSAMTNKQKQIMLNELIGTYLDGFDGR